MDEWGRWFSGAQRRGHLRLVGGGGGGGRFGRRDMVDESLLRR